LISWADMVLAPSVAGLFKWRQFELAVALESFTEERLRGGDVTRSTEVGFDGFALFINSALEVDPPPAHLKVSLVSTRQESPTGCS